MGGGSESSGGIYEANPPGLCLRTAALNYVHTAGEMGRNASSADEKSKGMQTAGDVQALM